MKRHFENDLRDIRRLILEMGGDVEAMISDTLALVVDRNADAAVRILARERDVNLLQNLIDEACLRVLALHQPLASDLRFLAAVMKMTADLERMGDLAVNIVQGARRLNTERPVKPYTDLPQIARLAMDMVRTALNALVNRDAETAQHVLEADEEVDELRDKSFRELLEIMKSDSAKVPACLQLLLIANHYERIADHATNIAEDVIYIVTGRDVRHHQEEASEGATPSPGEQDESQSTR